MARTKRSAPITRQWLESIVLKSESGCWEWQMAKGRWGYGLLCENYKTQHAHRIYYRYFKGKIPNGKIVRHTCDNTGCVNPEHLIIGTNLENTWDAIARNRLKSFKLMPDDVIKIRASKLTQTAIARNYGVNQSTVSRIKSFHRRKQLTNNHQQ